MDHNTLANSLKYAVRISHTEEGWISPLLDAIKDVDYDTARWKPAPEVASIWEIIAHAIPYTQSRICDFTGEARTTEEDWPIVEIDSEDAWIAMKGRATATITRLQEVVEALTPEDLAASIPGKNLIRSYRLMDIAIHDAYHAGQIVKLTQIREAVEN